MIFIYYPYIARLLENDSVFDYRGYPSVNGLRTDIPSYSSLHDPHLQEYFTKKFLGHVVNKFDMICHFMIAFIFYFCLNCNSRVDQAVQAQLLAELEDQWHQKLLQQEGQ